MENLGQFRFTMEYTTRMISKSKHKKLSDNPKKTEEIIYPIEIYVKKKGLFSDFNELRGSKEDDESIYMAVLWGINFISM